MTSALVALGWIVALTARGLVKWREHGVRSLISCLLLIAAFPVAVFVGHTLRSAIFSYNLDRWNDAVAWVTNHNQPNQNSSIGLPQQYADLAYGVHYKLDGECGLMVDFFWGSGFPVKHTVRRYAANSGWMEMEQCRSGLYRGRMISKDWYEISR